MMRPGPLGQRERWAGSCEPGKEKEKEKIPEAIDVQEELSLRAPPRLEMAPK